MVAKCFYLIVGISSHVLVKQVNLLVLFFEFMVAKCFYLSGNFFPDFGKASEFACTLF